MQRNERRSREKIDSSCRSRVEESERVKRAEALRELRTGTPGDGDLMGVTWQRPTERNRCGKERETFMNGGFTLTTVTVDNNTYYMF